MNNTPFRTGSTTYSSTYLTNRTSRVSVEGGRDEGRKAEVVLEVLFLVSPMLVNEGDGEEGGEGKVLLVVVTFLV